MPDVSQLPTVIALPMFERAAKGLLTEDDLDALIWRLSENPTEGVVMAGTGGVRKLRIGLTGRGRSSGARVIYYYRSQKGRVYLLFTYPKNEADNLSDDGKKLMREVVTALNREP